MNNYLTWAGTQPVYLGDIDFMQDAVKQAVLLLIRSMANDADATPNVILQGVDFAASTAYQLTWTDGVVVLDGEILPISAGSLPRESGDVPYFHVVSTTSGSRTFKDGQTHDCFETRVATIDMNSADGVAVASVARLPHISSNVTLSSTTATGDFITGADLRRKSDAWYLYMYISVASGENVVAGTVTFNAANGVTREIYDSIDEGGFPVIIAVPSATKYANAWCRIHKAANLTITLEIMGSTSITMSESAAAVINTVIPKSS